MNRFENTSAAAEDAQSAEQLSPNVAEPAPEAKFERPNFLSAQAIDALFKKIDSEQAEAYVESCAKQAALNVMRDSTKDWMDKDKPRPLFTSQMGDPARDPSRRQKFIEIISEAIGRAERPFEEMQKDDCDLSYYLTKLDHVVMRIARNHEEEGSPVVLGRDQGQYYSAYELVSDEKWRDIMNRADTLEE